MRKLFLLAVLSLSLVSAITVYSKTFTKEPIAIVNQELISKYNLDENQTNMLKKINFDKDEIENGSYIEKQEQFIKYYNFVQKYLNEKYPSYDLNICDIKSLKYNNSISSFSFSENNENKKYIVYLYEDQFGYSALDDFWGHLIENDFSEYIFEKLKYFKSIEDIKANIQGLKGIDYCESINIDGIINNNINNNIKIILRNDLENYDEEIEKIKNKIIDIGIEGIYHVRSYDENGKILIKYDFRIEGQ